LDTIYARCNPLKRRRKTKKHKIAIKTHKIELQNPNLVS
jgi:hypothetical protein